MNKTELRNAIIRAKGLSLADGVPCDHVGCLHHVTHECEGCGRIAGRYPDWSTYMRDAWKLVMEMVNDGWCVALLFDDDGHWSLATDGIQSVPRESGPQIISTSFWVEKDDWYDTPEEAICHKYLEAYGDEETCLSLL